ncbi:MAG: hypothetical protein ACFCUU_04105 [Cyclobacteriaceae bacterium]
MKLKLSGGFVKIIIWSFLLSLAYAIVRYHVFKGIDWSLLPLYTLNKSISITALLLIAISYSISSTSTVVLEVNERKVLQKKLGMTGFYFAVVHVFLSLLLSDAKYYPNLFYGDSLLTTELVLVYSTGFASIIILTVLWLAGQSIHSTFMGIHWSKLRNWGYWALLLTALHVIIHGSNKWLSPSQWPGYMPPLTLISFVIAMVPLVKRMTKALKN